MKRKINKNWLSQKMFFLLRGAEDTSSCWNPLVMLPRGCPSPWLIQWCTKSDPVLRQGTPLLANFDSRRPYSFAEPLLDWIFLKLQGSLGHLPHRLFFTWGLMALLAFSSSHPGAPPRKTLAQLTPAWCLLLDGPGLTKLARQFSGCRIDLNNACSICITRGWACSRPSINNGCVVIMLV